jgi:hypothetical protein
MLFLLDSVEETFYSSTMFTRDQIDQLKKLLIANNETLRKTMREEIEIEAEKIKKNGSVERLKMQIRLDRVASEGKDVAILLSKLEKSQEYIGEELKEMMQEVKNAEKKLSAKIKASQEDTIEALSDVVNTGYTLHDERIQRLEDKVGLPPLGQKH